MNGHLSTESTPPRPTVPLPPYTNILSSTTFAVWPATGGGALLSFTASNDQLRVVVLNNHKSFVSIPRLISPPNSNRASWYWHSVCEWRPGCKKQFQWHVCQDWTTFWGVVVVLFVLCDHLGESGLQKDCCWWLMFWLHERFIVIYLRVKWRVFIRWWYLCLWSWLFVWSVLSWGYQVLKVAVIGRLLFAMIGWLLFAVCGRRQSWMVYTEKGKCRCSQNGLLLWLSQQIQQYSKLSFLRHNICNLFFLLKWETLGMDKEQQQVFHCRSQGKH